MHSVHAVALLLAALPVALIISWLCRPHALLCAAVAGAIAVIAGFAPILVNSASQLSATTLIHMGVDSFKIIGTPVLLTWLANKLPPNYAMHTDPPGASRLLHSQEPRRPAARR
jgi:hypothetical protein